MSSDRQVNRHDRPDLPLGQLERILFDLAPDGWHGFSTERLWAEKVGLSINRIANVPFFVTGVSYADTVSARIREDSLVFDAVKARGRHSTYRVLVSGGIENPRCRLRWRALEALGCTYESTARLVAVDVPPSTNVHDVYGLLSAGEEAGDWDFEEGHCGHAV
jgi:hypothetical protein